MNHKCSIEGCLQNHPYGKHVANEYQPKTYNYELRGIPAYIFACVALPFAAVLFLALSLVLVVGIPSFFLVWGVVYLWVELWHRAAKLCGYRRAKTPADSVAFFSKIRRHRRAKAPNRR